jgi:hypothetical protein
MIDEAIDEVLSGNLDQNLEDAEKQTILEVKKCLAPHTSKTNVLYILRNRHRFYKSVTAIRRQRNIN